MKRKDLEGAFDDLSSSPSLKSRRLDAELFSSMNEDRSNGFEVFEQKEEEPVTVTSSSVVMQAADDDVCGDDKALVLYNPATSFYKTPASEDFSIIVNSGMVPGLRDHMYSWGNSKLPKRAEDGVGEEKREASDDRWAVVPWVESPWPSSIPQTQAASLSEQMEGEEVEMMDTDDNNNNNNSYNGTHLSGMVEGTDGYQHWRQQQPLPWMQPQHLSNTFPVTW